MTDIEFTELLATMPPPGAVVEPVGAHTDDERAEPACEQRCAECAALIAMADRTRKGSEHV